MPTALRIIIAGIVAISSSECARQIVRKYERRQKLLEDPLALKIKELSRLGDATRILNSLKGKDVYDGGPESWLITNLKI